MGSCGGLETGLLPTTCDSSKSLYIYPFGVKFQILERRGAMCPSADPVAKVETGQCSLDMREFCRAVVDVAKANAEEGKGPLATDVTHQTCNKRIYMFHLIPDFRLPRTGGGPESPLKRTRVTFFGRHNELTQW